MLTFYWYQWFYQHPSRDSVSPVCRFFTEVAPLGWFSHRVNMPVCLWFCLSVDPPPKKISLFCPFLSILVLVLLSASLKRFCVSRMRDLWKIGFVFYRFIDTIQRPDPWIQIILVLHKILYNINICSLNDTWVDLVQCITQTPCSLQIYWLVSPSKELDGPV